MTHISSSNSFLGRESELAALVDALSGRSQLIVGPRRIGKTTLLRALIKRPDTDWVGVRVDLQYARTAADAVDRIERELEGYGITPPITEEVTSRLSSLGIGALNIGLRDRASEDPWRRLAALLTIAVNQTGKPRGVVLALDEVPWWLDAIRKNEGPEHARAALAALRYLRQRDDLAPHLRIILTGSVGLAGLAHALGASAELNDLTPVFELGPLSEPAGEALFEMEVGNRALGAGAARRAHEVSGGSPHWIKVLAERAAAHVPEPGEIAADTVTDAADALLEPRMRHLFADEGREHLERRYGQEQTNLLIAILDSAAAAPGPAPEEALITSGLAAGATTRSAARDLLHLLVDEFYLCFDNLTSTYSFFLPLLKSWWRLYGGHR